MNETFPIPIPLSALEHYQYCPRQCALIHVDHIWVDNAHTLRGQLGHHRVDNAPDSTSRGSRVLRHLNLWSERYGLTGRADVVEIRPDGDIVPVEYKIGRRHGIAADVQLCAQALCLEEMSGQAVTFGYLWIASQRRRFRVELDNDLREATLESVSLVRGILSGQGLPPAPHDARCNSCQFLGQCLPGLVANPEVISRYQEQVLMQCEP